MNFCSWHRIINIDNCINYWLIFFFRRGRCTDYLRCKAKKEERKNRELIKTLKKDMTNWRWHMNMQIYRSSSSDSGLAKARLPLNSYTSSNLVTYTNITWDGMNLIYFFNPSERSVLFYFYSEISSDFQHNFIKKTETWL